ncbi:hypothetical protein ASA1KI_05430 [Opitutales bacterium ASA1]|nr:hypothetical protein ASA1KI_05430 [Opitutales bacterium ASA1]
MTRPRGLVSFASVKRRPAFALLASVAFSAAAAQTRSHDFYVCAAINRDYVIGSRIVTLNGLYRLGGDGAWEHFGVNDTTITALAFDPRDRDMLYTTTLNGLWTSHDGGRSWRIPTGPGMTEGRDVSVDPNAPDTVYLALPDGIAVSDDRGWSFERRENGLPERARYTQTIEVDRTTKARVLAGTVGGVYLTEDAGGVWRRVLPTATTVNDLQQSPHDPADWLATTDTHGVWRSRDRGETWTRIEALADGRAWYNVTFDPTDSRRIAAAGWWHGAWTSEDGGNTWSARNTGLPAPHRVWRVGVDPNRGRLYASVFKETLYHSDDFGRTWTADALAGSLVAAFVSVPVREEEVPER